jgi:hypothetical protein
MHDWVGHAETLPFRRMQKIPAMMENKKQQLLVMPSA